MSLTDAQANALDHVIQAKIQETLEKLTTIIESTVGEDDEDGTDCLMVVADYLIQYGLITLVTVATFDTRDPLKAKRHVLEMFKVLVDNRLKSLDEWISKEGMT